MVIEGVNPVDIIFYNIETNNSKIIELFDGRFIDYSRWTLTRSVFSNHEQGFDMYLNQMIILHLHMLNLLVFQLIYLHL